MEFTLEQRENYAGRCSDRHGSIEFEYYTRRQMRALYPSGGYAVSGEVGFVGKNPIGTAETSAGKLPVYVSGSHNPWTHSVRGYVAAEGDRFLGVVKNVLVIRVQMCIRDSSRVSLSVSKQNRAVRLYRDIGFEVVREDQGEYLMQLWLREM